MSDRDQEVTRLVAAEGPRLLAYTRRTCGDGSDAEDIVQETFVLAFRSWHQLDREQSAKAWLYAIARRVCQRMHRKRADEPAFLESFDALLPGQTATIPDLRAIGSGPHADRIRSEAREIVERAIARLPHAYRVPLVLAEIAELISSEIADVLGLKEATVKTRLHRARLKMRAVLAASLPQRRLPPEEHGRTVCLDLVQAKLDALARKVPFPFSDDALCERCRTVIGTLDLAAAACSSLVVEELPERLQREIGLPTRRQAPAGRE
jgi:RNA polymerase sigma-70 factor (ECF subfamily)